MKKVVLNIEGMMCQGCVAGVTVSLEDVAGVQAVEVSLEKQQAAVTYDEAQATEAQLAAAVVEAGFKVV